MGGMDCMTSNKNVCTGGYYKQECQPLDKIYGQLIIYLLSKYTLYDNLKHPSRMLKFQFLAKA